MPKKEFYRRNLPHYQTPGQTFFVTFSLVGSIPNSVIQPYRLNIQYTKNRFCDLEANNAKGNEIQNSRDDYYKAIKDYKNTFHNYLDKSLTAIIDLTKINNMNVIKESLGYWNNIKLENHAYSIMSNHIHWLFTFNEKDNLGKTIYLSDLLHSVKLFTARNINTNESRKGKLWCEESFDTTIRNSNHFWNVVKYIINNPVKANLVKDWSEWKGTFIHKDLIHFL